LLQEYENEKEDMFNQIINHPHGDAKVLGSIISLFSFEGKDTRKPVN